MQWLQKNDPFQREWYTSGVRDKSADAATGTGFMWESTGEKLEGSLMSVWLQTPSASQQVGVIIYKFGKTGPGWVFTDNPAEKRPYICKIPQTEAYRILLTNRDYDYGVDDVDALANLEKGPHFIVQPESTVVVNRPDAPEPVSLECVVQANPAATYKWFRGETFETEITIDLDERYTVTNGKLTIANPNEDKDATMYRCEAENKFGKVISNEVEISFGYLGEFNNVQDAGTRAKEYDGANIQCSNLQYRPAVMYQWIKGNDMQFVRPEFQSYIFISNNGKLYFSEVTETDAAEYMCIAVLTGVNRYTIGTNQPPMRTSLPINLYVDSQSPKADWGPVIQNDFIAIFPRNPLRGQDVRLECFAYGSSNTPFYYTWSRDDRPMSTTAQSLDHDRVLVLPNAQLEDSGIYRCTVNRGNSAGDTKTVQLSLGAKPYFVSPLRDQHVDVGSQLTWICNARANPAPTYRWYKNGVLLTTDTNNDMKVQKNVLTISNLDAERHDGMYQCGAENTHGVSLSNAQLRVLALAPTLTKNPPPASLWAPEGGNITLRCQPEGAPFPTIEWSKDGSPITSDGQKFTVFGNGNLHITLLTMSDRGRYTCKATNIFGEVSASSLMDIAQGAAITLPPNDVKSVVNRTVFIQCEASYPKGVDMVFEWLFNGFPIDYSEVWYRQAQGKAPGGNGLYIVNAQFKHEGEYICKAVTPFNSQSASGYLTIVGPPRQPMGVHGVTGTVTQNSTEIVWMAGSNGGGVVSVHIIQVSNEFEPGVWTDFMTIRVGDSLQENNQLVTGMHSAIADGLNPGTGYQFRVIAQNEYGRGIPSDPSPYVQTLSAPPSVYPNNLRGGGGSVGDLTVRWDALHRSEWGANTVGYRIYWRKKDESNLDAKFGLAVVDNPTKDWVVMTVGALNYFLLYEVKIQAFNPLGVGPNSSVVEVYSAEDLPIGTPEQLSANSYNETVVELSWVPVPDDRLHAKGKILGYRINYWYEGEDPTDQMWSINYYGQCDYGLILGVDTDTYIVIDAQVYNSAGLGARSNYIFMKPTKLAPLVYPQEVHISSAGRGQVRIWWRGVDITTDEEDISGFAIWLWTASESFYTAELIEVEEMLASTTLIKNISEHRLYAMRVSAVGGGGYGKKSPTMYFAMEGEVLIDYNLAQTIDTFMSDGVHMLPSIVLIFLSCLIASMFFTCTDDT